MGVDPLIQRLDQMTTSISQLLQLARVGQSFSAGSYQQVLLLDDVVKPRRTNWRLCWRSVSSGCC